MHRFLLSTALLATLYSQPGTVTQANDKPARGRFNGGAVAGQSNNGPTVNRQVPQNNQFIQPGGGNSGKVIQSLPKTGKFGGTQIQGNNGAGQITTFPDRRKTTFPENLKPTQKMPPVVGGKSVGGKSIDVNRGFPGKIRPEILKGGKQPDFKPDFKKDVVRNPGKLGPNSGIKLPSKLIDVGRASNKKAVLPLGDRLKRGDLNRVVDAKFGKQLDLKKQFQVHQQGDLVRQLKLSDQLVKNGGWQKRFCGPIDPFYTKHCFSHAYCGPGWYPTYCWYPTWTPWVDWCWNYTCVPVCDPRPIWCQPIYCSPCGPWVGWDYPVWSPMPVVTCGTWVDVPVVAINAGYDVQLLAVRFVDPGHPEQNQGPRYRVWVRNNSLVSIEQPFNLLAYASNDRTPGMGLPQTGIRVARLDAGQIASFDMRLPIEANLMSQDAEGRKLPFQYLHVIADSHREVAEAFEENNGSILDRRDILPIDPVVFAAESDETDSGMVLKLAGEGFGPEAGQVIVNVGGMEMQAEVMGWYDLGARVRLPGISLAGDTQAEVVVVRGDRAASNPLSVVLDADESVTTAYQNP